MASAKLVDMGGSELGSVELNEAVFSVAPNEPLVHEVVVALLNARRQGNAVTKERGSVRGGGRKPFRQKGTGHARQGSSREPQMKGGGTVFGPRKRSYRQDVPVRTKRQALCCALSDRVRNENLCVMRELACSEVKTKPFAEMMKWIAPDGKKTLFITAAKERNVLLSSRNIPRVKVRTAADLNALDVLDAYRVVLVQDAVAQLEERLT
jgi:large subunit ribosomal protein L4